jgi:hypothetical protein
MKVGVTGHQERDGIDWAWVSRAIRTELAQLAVTEALSSLAAGTDQIFAEVALDLRIPVLAVLPLLGYDAFFEGAVLVNYRRLLERCARFNLPITGDEEEAFFEAGKYIADHCDVLLAVWDGQPAQGLGGTADVVTYAKRKTSRIIHFNPLKETIRAI